MEKKICGIVGSKKIPEDQLSFATEALRKEIEQAVSDGFLVFLSGFSDGVELIAAEIIADMKDQNQDIFLEAVLPYRNRLKNGKSQFQSLIRRCNGVQITSEQYYRYCYMPQVKNIVSSSDRILIVCAKGERDDVFCALRYAYDTDKDIRIIHIPPVESKPSSASSV